MKRLILSIILFALASATIISAQTNRAEVANPIDFQKIESDLKVPNCRATLKTCGEKALVALDLAGFGGPDYIKFNAEVFNFKNNVGIYLFTITGLKDPLVKGERMRVAFTKSGTTYSFVQAGRQYLCAGGGWQKECLPKSDKSNKNSTTRREIANADDFQFISFNGRAVVEATKPCYKSLLECGSTKIGFYGIEGIGGEADNENFKEETFVFADKNTGKNIGVYLLTMKGFEDDSVSGERLRIEFEKKGKGWELVQGGKQYQCARGSKAGEWTKILCP